MSVISYKNKEYKIEEILKPKSKVHMELLLRYRGPHIGLTCNKLIVKALIKSNFDLKEALKLNYPKKVVNYDNVRYYSLSIEKQLGPIEKIKQLI